MNIPRPLPGSCVAWARGIVSPTGGSIKLDHASWLGLVLATNVDLVGNKYTMYVMFNDSRPMWLSGCCVDYDKVWTIKWAP